jgi:hypothetical protein
MSLFYHLLPANNGGNGGLNEKSLPLGPEGDCDGTRVALAASTGASITSGVPFELVLQPTVNMFVGVSTVDGAGAVASAGTTKMRILAGTERILRYGPGTRHIAWVAG